MSIQPGSVATRVPRYPSGIDFSCGFQSSRPSGTRSNTRRAIAASRSRSARNNSVIFIFCALLCQPNNKQAYMTPCVIILWDCDEVLFYDARRTVMRADRLMSALLLLQARGQMTGRELAEKLE